jgi:Reverse transcriptase (RNA-dependent DNA polymerase)
VDIQGAFDYTGFESIRLAASGSQGGVLSPLLWSFVIDKFLNDLDRQGFAVIEIADDLVITVRGNNNSILSERIQSALNYVIGWCKQDGLSINTAKTIVIPFNRRRKLSLNLEP